MIAGLPLAHLKKKKKKEKEEEEEEGAETRKFISGLKLTEYMWEENSRLRWCFSFQLCFKSFNFGFYT